MTKQEALKKYFGYDSFREGQAKLIDAILSTRDVLGVMPTGAGKSICYQIPAMLMEGVTLVISPLISLMKDQVSALTQAGIPAAYLNSSLTSGQYAETVRAMQEGKYKLIYVAPERLLTEQFLNAVSKIDISMITVDEAHCISQWGQDFRPSYLHIIDFINRLPYRPVIGAFTATATKEVKADIEMLLNLSYPLILTTGFDRKNLKFTVLQTANKWKTAEALLKEHEEECGIIYCLTRKTVEEVCEDLIKEGYSATRYHAGLSDEERRHNQEDFLYDRCRIMVATNAFGMGIDKSNVRFVIHYNMPKNIESYYQEAGRAGRDGLPAECIMLYSGQDVVMNQFFIDQMQAPDGVDAESAAAIREREQERLKKMTYYCMTNECLRDYILRYFGEYGSNYCGNCSNCQTKYEEKDITETARRIFGCIRESRWAYGITTIIDAVHGSTSNKMKKTGLYQNPYFESCADIPLYQLRQIMNFLLMEEYLELSRDRYPVVRLAKKAETFPDSGQIFMKMAKEEQPRTDKQQRHMDPRTGRQMGQLTKDQADPDLFEKLRMLRAEIAREESVPPYIVFSDKTLVHMCLLKPASKQEMMVVNGVGELKFARYGERFLETLHQALHAE